jgi:phosphoribosylaminoimidazole-succinocarboxamide synthase
MSPSGSLREVIRAQLDHCLVETTLPIGTRSLGKVRDVYRLDGDRMALVTTDRISAFDHILPQPVPFKGQVLNRLAAYFFRGTRDVAPNHVIDVPDPNVTIAIACDPIPVEFVVRGYLAGHAWRVYSEGARVLCGAQLPDGLGEAERLPFPILTPATKATSGHDEDISPHEIVGRGLVDEPTFEYISHLALQLFARGTELAAARGLLLVDTKYEFGRAPDGSVLLIDEVHTPDSSRYYVAEGYEDRLAEGEPQHQLSKEFVREWLMARGFRGLEGQHPPDLPDDLRVEIAERYIELYERLTGETFEPETSTDPAARVLASLR